MFASSILARMVSFLMYSESIPGGDMVRALWTIVAFRYDVPRLYVSFDSSHMWWLEHTVSALPLPSGRHSLLTGVNFIHLGHDNIYNIRITFSIIYSAFQISQKAKGVISLLVNFQCIPGGCVFPTIRANVASGDYVLRLNVNLHTVLSFRAVITLGALEWTIFHPTDFLFHQSINVCKKQEIEEWNSC